MGLFFLNQPAAQAVRNRKDYFLKSCMRLGKNGKKDINVLILGCGPATDVKQYLTEKPDSRIRFNLINKYLKNLAENGEFIIGNFSHLNPTKRLMEVLSDWYINHRSKFDLLRMAVEAEADEDQVTVEMEDWA